MKPSNPVIAVLTTMNTKSKEAHFVGDVLARAGTTPWIIDLSMEPHDVPGASVTGAQVAEAAGASWPALGELTRRDAAVVMIEGGSRVLLEEVTSGKVAGVIGLGGANGTDLVCSILRNLPQARRQHQSLLRAGNRNVHFPFIVPIVDHRMIAQSRRRASSSAAGLRHGADPKVERAQDAARRFHRRFCRLEPPVMSLCDRIFSRPDSN